MSTAPGAPPAAPPDARRLAWLGFVWLFLTVAAMYMVMPVRSAFLIGRSGPQALPPAFVASAAATWLAVWLYDRFTHLERARVVGGAVLALEAGLLAWWPVMVWAHGSELAAFLFYLFTDVFAIMAVTVFWTFADDAFRPAEARRDFGVMASAGGLGAITGSALVAWLAPRLGLVWMLPLAAALYLGAYFAFRAMEAEAAFLPPRAARGPAALERPGTGSVVKAIWASPCLRLLVLLVALERMVPDFSNFIFGAAFAGVYEGEEALAAAFARFGLLQNMAAFLASALVAGPLLARAGAGPGLMSAGAANLLGFAWFAAAPGFLAAALPNGLEGVCRYSTFKTAKEAFYTVTGRGVVFRVKAFVEMFLYRLARGLAGLLLLILTHPALGALTPRGVALCAMPLALLWVWTGSRLAGEFSRLEKSPADVD